MNYFEYIEQLKDKKIGVIGYGVSNRPLVRVLLDAGCDVTVCDKRTAEAMGEAGEDLLARGGKLCSGDDYLDHLEFDVIFRTPGVLPTVPQLKAAAERGTVLTSEMEALCALCPCRIVAITGSDGKTTTSTVTAKLLETAGYRVHLGGNIGTPLFDKLPEIAPDDFVVLELSSFQLHSMKCSPDRAIITNISPNHLDVHSDFEDYVSAKKNIYRNQTRDGVLVLNAKDAHTAEFAAEANGEVRLFSSKGPVENGAYMQYEILCRANHGETEAYMESSDIRIPGVHNVENYLAALAAVGDLITRDQFVEVAKTFPGVPHRMEYLRTINGVKFYNDSIASSPTRTIAGLHALPVPPIVILGGHDKHIPFDTLGDELCLHAKAAVLCGETAERIAAAIKASEHYDPERFPVIVLDNFRSAVQVAYGLGGNGDIVTLSPACSSFDRFKNFEERGNIFRQIVMEMEP